jgi:hypothetical protein
VKVSKNADNRSWHGRHHTIPDTPTDQTKRNVPKQTVKLLAVLDGYGTPSRLESFLVTSKCKIDR